MNKSEKIRLIYGIFLSVLTAAVGITFIITVAELYYSGLDQGLEVIYTLDRIKERLTLPVVFLFTWFAAIIAGFVLSVVFPIQEKRRAGTDDKKILAMLKSRVPEKASKEGFDEARKGIKKLQIARICVWSVTSAVLAVGAIFIMIYIFDPTHFSEQKFREDMLVLVRNVMGWIGAGLACSLAAVLYDAIAVKKELAYVKKAIATGDRQSVPAKKEVSGKKVTIFTVVVAGLTLLAIAAFALAPSAITAAIQARLSATEFILFATVVLALVIGGIFAAKALRNFVPQKADGIITLCTRIAMGAVVVAFIIVGAINGGAGDVLTKAIAICTECIGLG